jgi:Spy/CpxP family protein refolding chaperone
MKNRNNLIITALITVFGLLIFSSVLIAQSYWRDNYDQRWWNYNVPNDYQLTQDQVDEINQYRSEYDNKIIPLQKEMRTLRIEMEGYMNRNDADLDQIKDYRNQMRDLENQIEDYRFEARKKMNSVFTDNQQLYFNDNSNGWWDGMYDRCGWGYGDMDYDYNNYDRRSNNYRSHGCW